MKYITKILSWFIYLIPIIFITGHIPLKIERMYTCVKEGGNIRKTVFSDDPRVESYKSHAIHLNNLYLLTQRVGVGYLGKIILAKPKWDVESLSDFRKMYPEYKKYLPDPDAKNGGVYWIMIK